MTNTQESQIIARIASQIREGDLSPYRIAKTRNLITQALRQSGIVVRNEHIERVLAHQ